MKAWIRAGLSVLMIAGAAAPVAAQSAMRVFIDLPARDASVPVPFMVGGWALDLTSSSDSGVDAVHIWAYPYIGANLGSPRFLGPAIIGISRPDVAAVYGPQFANAGYHLVVDRDVPAGLYPAS